MSNPDLEMEDVPEDEEMDFEDEGVDLLDALGQMFTTEDGETLPSILLGLKQTLEMQNKILIKILSALNKSAAA
jgi:hypothetical protein